MFADRSAPSSPISDNPLMPRLYQAAIGPLNTAYYQQLFERFDALGKPLPTWNWAAGFCTLGWMGLRGLWQAAAIYAAVIAGVALLWWGLDLHHTLPLPAALALLLLLALLAVLVPGLGGNALYHRTVRARTMQALTDSSTLSQAMQQLQGRAPTSTRLQWATTGGALAMLLAAALVWGVTSLPTPGKRPPTTGTQGPTQQDTARALAALRPAAPAADPTAAASTAATAAPDSAAVPLSTGTDATGSAAPTAPAPIAALAPATATSPAPSTEPVTTAPAAPALAAAPTASATPATSSTPVAAADKASPPAEPHAAEPAAKKAKAAKPEKTSKAEPAEKPAKPAKAAAKAEPTEKSEKAEKSAKAAPKGLQPGKFYLNNGIYAQPENARRVARQLREAGLPVFTQTLQSSKGDVTRVRVGPLDSRHQADLAARKAQALHLEGQVFQHAPD